MGTVEDRLEILELIGRYSFGADGDVSDDYANVFCEDGEFVGRTGQPDEIRVTGRDAILRFHQGAIARRTRRPGTTRHQQSTTVFVSLDADRAVTRSYLLTTTVGAMASAPWLGLTSVYEDHLARTRSGWRIQQRRTLPDVTGVLDDRRRAALPAHAPEETRP